MKKNDGFSLVELIIVIAIMAVLIGILAPTYLKYVQKSAVSSDKQLITTISRAITYAATDQKIQEEPASLTVINSLTSPTKLDDFDATTNLFAQDILATLGWSDFDQSDYVHKFKSKHASNSTIYVQYQATSHTPYAVWITYTDQNGRGNITDGATSLGTISQCICIR